jgi:hypothetical protein
LLQPGVFVVYLVVIMVNKSGVVYLGMLQSL